MRTYNAVRSSLLTLLMGFTTAGFAAEELPAHGSTILRGAPEDEKPAYFGSEGWMNAAFGVSFIYFPSVDNENFEDPLGVELHGMWLNPGGAGYKLSVGYEAWDSKNRDVVDDAKLVPLGISLLLSPLPAREGVAFWGEAGLRYVFVDADNVSGDGGSYDNAVTALFGGNVSVDIMPGLGLGAFVGYQIDVSESQDENGQDLSLEGLMTSVAVRFEI